MDKTFVVALNDAALRRLYRTRAGWTDDRDRAARYTETGASRLATKLYRDSQGAVRAFVVDTK